jgi:hypothetical protein
MITLRYHTMSLIAMLLTLGLGIWIGTAIGSPGLAKEQSALLAESGSKLDAEIAEREEDARLLDENRKALAGLVPHFTRSLLYGKRVAIIRTGDYPDAAQAASDALAQSGATVESSITINTGLDELTDKERREILGSLALQTSDSAPGDPTALISLLVTALKNGTAQHPDIEDSIARMSESGLISYSGDFPMPVDLVVVVGGSSSPPGEIEATDDQAREKNVLNCLVSSDGFAPDEVVGCEPVDVVTSSIPLYQDISIASVDCIDEPVGSLDLVYALHGESASYGIKSGATLIAPASLETDSGLI